MTYTTVAVISSTRFARIGAELNHIFQYKLIRQKRILFFYKSSFLRGLTSLSNGWFLSASETSAASKFSHWIPRAGSA